MLHFLLRFFAGASASPVRLLDFFSFSPLTLEVGFVSGWSFSSFRPFRPFPASASMSLAAPLA